MRYFVCAADHMSITKAAKELYISQPSISRQIALMEDELGFKLFNRQGQKLELTIPGELLHRELKILLGNVDEVIQHAHSLKDQTPTRLRIGLMHNMDTSKFLHGELKKFCEENPSVSLEICAKSFEDIIKMFLEDKLDIVFLLLFASEALAGILPISTMNVYNAPTRLIVPQELRTSVENYGVKTFSEHPFLIVSTHAEESILSRTGLNEVMDAGIVPSRIIWAESVDTMITMAEEGLGIGVLGPSVRVYENDRVFVYTLPDNQHPVGVSMCWRYNNSSAPLNAFIDLMKQTHPFQA